MVLRIVSWNINGIRSYLRSSTNNSNSISNLSNPLLDLIQRLKADIICLQETKLGDVSTLTKEMACLPGFDSFWSFSSKRKGYSGVATISRKGLTKEFKEGFGFKEHMDEGRCIMSDHGHFVLFNVYFVNGGMGEHRLQYKMEFYRDFKLKVKQLLDQGRQVVVTGDVNTAHTELDVWNPSKLSKTTGFLPEERAWIDEFLDLGMVDAYRFFFPLQRTYTFWDMRTMKRQSNEGWRIDYFFVSKGIFDKVTESNIITNVEYTELGSDHCPITLYLKLYKTKDFGFNQPKNAFNLLKVFQEKPSMKITSLFKPKTSTTLILSKNSPTKSEKEKQVDSVIVDTASNSVQKGNAKSEKRRSVSPLHKNITKKVSTGISSPVNLSMASRTTVTTTAAGNNNANTRQKKSSPTKRNLKKLVDQEEIILPNEEGVGETCANLMSS